MDRTPQGLVPDTSPAGNLLWRTAGKSRILGKSIWHVHLYLYNADRAENQNLVSALSITINKILCQFFEFTQNLKRSHLTVVFVSERLPDTFDNLWFMALISAIIILLSPVDSINKPLDSEQRKIEKKKTCRYIVAIYSISLILKWNSLTCYVKEINFALFIVLCSMIFGIVSNTKSNRKQDVWNDKIVKLTVHRQKTTVQKFFVRNHKKCARISATKERRKYQYGIT